MSEDVALRFSQLGRTGKAQFLARVAQEQTIYAREAYPEQLDDAVALAASNELVHRLVGYIGKVLTDDTSADQDASFIHMIVKAANHSVDRYGRWLDEAAQLSA